MPRLSILLADDHTIVRQGLRKLLEEQPEWEVIAEAGDGREAVRQVEQHQPDIAILDVAMPLLNGVESNSTDRQELATHTVIILSMHADDAYVMRC